MRADFSVAVDDDGWHRRGCVCRAVFMNYSGNRIRKIEDKFCFTITFRPESDRPDSSGAKILPDSRQLRALPFAASEKRMAGHSLVCALLFSEPQTRITPGTDTMFLRISARNCESREQMLGFSPASSESLCLRSLVESSEVWESGQRAVLTIESMAPESASLVLTF